MTVRYGRTDRRTWRNPNRSATTLPRRAAAKRGAASGKIKSIQMFEARHEPPLIAMWRAVFSERIAAAARGAGRGRNKCTSAWVRRHDTERCRQRFGGDVLGEQNISIRKFYGGNGHRGVYFRFKYFIYTYLKVRNNFSGLVTTLLDLMCCFKCTSICCRI